LWKTFRNETEKSNLAWKVGKDGFCGTASAEHGTVDGSVVTVIAAKIDTGTNANRALRRFQSAGILLRLGVGNTVTLQMAPGGGRRAKPIFHLGNDEAAELLVSELLGAKNGNRDERFAGWSIGGSDLADHREIVGRSSAVAVQDQHGMGDGRLVSGVVEATDAAGRWFRFSDEVRSGGTVGSYDDGASTEGFSTV
jgi:hypothetical protein